MVFFPPPGGDANTQVAAADDQLVHCSWASSSNARFGYRNPGRLLFYDQCVWHIARLNEGEICVGILSHGQGIEWTSLSAGPGFRGLAHVSDGLPAATDGRRAHR